MNQAPEESSPQRGQIVDFDEVLLDACDANTLCELMAEAALLAGAFAPEGRSAQVETLAVSLQSGVRDLEMGRAHARRLAAALRRLARVGGAS